MKYYSQPCNVCGSMIAHSGKRGRPRVHCATCPAPKIVRVRPPEYDKDCARCGGTIVRTGVAGRPPKFCRSCATAMGATIVDHINTASTTPF